MPKATNKLYSQNGGNNIVTYTLTDSVPILPFEIDRTVLCSIRPSYHSMINVKTVLVISNTD